MDNSFRQHESDSLRLGGFSAVLQIFYGILQWLTSLIQLTEEEQDDAGIYLGHSGC